LKEVCDEKNNSKIFREMKRRWSSEDYPGGNPRFQLGLLAKDVAIFGLLPIGSVIAFKLLEASILGPGRPAERKRQETKSYTNESRSQIIQFHPVAGASGKAIFAKRAPGTLVRVRLLNSVETSGTSSAHAQIVDVALGREFLGGTLIGDATPDGNTGRIKVDFKFVKHPNRADIAVPIAARAMSLEGVLGLNADKKEGFFARASIRSASGNSGNTDSGSQDFKTMVARALASGLMQEFQSEANVANSNAQVLTLKPMTEFFVELTDYFPGQSK
jgi:hypothetical protein